MLTGRAARGSTWRVLDGWLTQWASDGADASSARPARTSPARKAAPENQAPAKPAPANQAPAKPAPENQASREAIGANPTRRYGSGGSRSLAR